MSAAARTGRCLYSADRAYVDAAGVGHEVLHLYATGHTTTGTPMDEWDWPEGLDLWHLVFDFDEHGRAIGDPAPFDQQWTGPPTPVITLRDGQPPPAAGVMREGELHVGCESRCTAPGAEFRDALTEFRAERHRHHTALAQIQEAQAHRSAVLARIDQVEAAIGDLLADYLRGDLGEDG
ncbi:hypothetical protein ACM01_14845 [Streptomyces viridochromogenes]|uniref:Uncharacterized protein n=1 Tax=Streptomyces viridochromogenes TaxID=1938 RepID=A0A0J7ZDN6_STRVR|nr:hypothetical protein [Streptomyces viridochromogenes]KMS74196.1 hypothetical protein ACM01_14845 [Streptomyces viridochromogenes]